MPNDNDNDDAPSEFSELSLSENAAITDEDVQENLGFKEDPATQPDPKKEAASGPGEDLSESITEA